MQKELTSTEIKETIINNRKEIKEFVCVRREENEKLQKIKQIKKNRLKKLKIYYRSKIYDITKELRILGDPEGHQYGEKIKSDILKIIQDNNGSANAKHILKQLKINGYKMKATNHYPVLTYLIQDNILKIVGVIKGKIGRPEHIYSVNKDNI